MPYDSYLAVTVFCVYMTIYILSQGNGDLVKDGIGLADSPAAFSCRVLRQR